MEILIILLIIAVIWLFIKSSNHDNEITRVNNDREDLVVKIEFLQRSISDLEKSRDEQRHKNYELRQSISELERELEQKLNEKLATALGKPSTSTYTQQNYQINDLSEVPSLVNAQNVEAINQTTAKISTTVNTEILDNIAIDNELKLDSSTFAPLGNQADSKLNATSNLTPNPNFPIYTYYHAKIEHKCPLPLAYSLAFNQFLLQQQIQAEQTNISAKIPPTIPQQRRQPQNQTANMARTAKAQTSRPSQASRASRATIPTEPSLFDKAFTFAKNWLTTGNIFVKIGMLMVIASAIAFLRYATTMGWIHVPIEAKLLGVVVSALGALAFAWTKREEKRSFSLIVQGGSIGIVLLTIFSAVKMYSLMSPTIGFIISFAMILLMAVLSIQQNAKALAVMAIFAGFLAPIWLSDGSGNHVLLFSYYAILNVGIFILAMFRPWRELNLLGFVFTYLIGSTWGGLNYTPADFKTTEPFVILFFFFYLLIPLRYAQQAEQLQEDSREDEEEEHEFYNKYKLNSGLLFGTPLVTLIAQVALLTSDTKIALSCVAMGLVYGALAFLLREHRHKPTETSMFATLQKTYTGLSASFLTLAVPIGLSAKATTTIFALEGAGAVWLGAKANPQRRRTLTWLAGGFLQLSSAVAFVVAYTGSGYGLHGVHADDMAIFNELYLSGILLAVAGLLCAWFSFNAVRTFNEHYSTDFDSELHANSATLFSRLNAWLTNDILVVVARLFFLWGMAWWLGTNLFEITRIIGYDSHDNIEIMYAWMIFITATAVTLPLLYRHRKGYHDGVVWMVTILLMATGGGVALIQWLDVVLFSDEVSLTWTIISWLVYAVGGFVVWRGLQTVRSSLIDLSVVVWFLAITLTVSTLVYQLMPHSWQRQSGWHWGIIFAIWMVVAVLDIFRPQALAWLAKRPLSSPYSPSNLSNPSKHSPSMDKEDRQNSLWQNIISLIVVMVLAGVFTITVILSGTDGWWLPVLNSVDGLQIVLAFLIMAWCVRHKIFAKFLVAYALFLSMIISISARMAGHWVTISTEISTEINTETWHNSHGGIQNLANWSDWNWLMIFGFWTVLGFGLWALLTNRLTNKSSVVRKSFVKNGSVLEILQVLFNSIIMVLMVMWLTALTQSGSVSPWIPLLNPLAVLQWSILALLLLWANGSDWQGEILDRSQRSLVVACLVLALISVMTLRFVFHFYQTEVVTWGMSMFGTAIIQMALTIVWSILGVVGWIVGSKRMSRPIWLLGALLMAIVLIKLILIDRNHLGDLFGIGSFFAYGMLCLTVGYFAPMPSFSSSSSEELDEEELDDEEEE